MSLPFSVFTLNVNVSINPEKKTRTLFTLRKESNNVDLYKLSAPTLFIHFVAFCGSRPELYLLLTMYMYVRIVREGNVFTDVCYFLCGGGGGSGQVVHGPGGG